MKTYTIGTLAYVDTLIGLIPCKVIAIEENVTVEVTANREPYKRGEVLDYPKWWIIPRECVFIRKGIYQIRNTYEWE